MLHHCCARVNNFKRDHGKRKAEDRLGSRTISRRFTFFGGSKPCAAIIRNQKTIKKTLACVVISSHHRYCTGVSRLAALCSRDMLFGFYVGMVLLWPAASLQNGGVETIAGLLAAYGLYALDHVTFQFAGFIVDAKTEAAHLKDAFENAALCTIVAWPFFVRPLRRRSHLWFPGFRRDCRAKPVPF